MITPEGKGEGGQIVERKKETLMKATFKKTAKETPNHIHPQRNGIFNLRK